jgi:glycosyltransferase involved in cell wall biosynthesis
MEQYVCAFRGRRDSYQAPLALAEASLLDQFITDAYATRGIYALMRLSPAAVRAKIGQRSEPGIPLERVSCLWGTTALEHLRHRIGFAPMSTYQKLDRNFSAAAARRARRTRSHLFLYSPYAWEAFTASYGHNPRKVLFQFHPHPVVEDRLLKEDAFLHPGVGVSFSGDSTSGTADGLALRERDAWTHADTIICASSFTKHSLLEAGCEEKLCRIVPYGTEVRSGSVASPPPRGFEALFVGSGSQRKGLHHLLLAWRRAILPKDSCLTLVCRLLDCEIERMIRETPKVKLLRGVAPGQLDQLYGKSSVFVMPSLVEGFGQVYLEALAQGCPVLGTANTCLPDLGTEADGIYLVAPGNIEELTGKLETLSRSLPGNSEVRLAARACATKFTWPAFRQALREALKL